MKVKRDGVHLFTSESVTEGHPDKVADQISDAILDDLYRQDPFSRVACETLVSTGMAIVAGEVTTKGYADVPTIVRKTIKRIGYTDPSIGFDWENCAVITSIKKQSPDIAMGVDKDGAGDQGLMFGYATNETEELMPMPITFAQKLAMRLAKVRRDGTMPYLKPDGKSQVTIEYHGGKAKRVHTVIIAAQHAADVSEKTVRADVEKHVIRHVIPANLLDNETVFHINSTGRFVIGGPTGDTGLTGRKIIVDTYGGVGSHGGGCFSGKDPTKVDRSGSYMARYIAKNIVAGGLADSCEVQLAYAIGVAEPVSVLVSCFGTEKIPEEKIEALVRKHFDMTPKGIIKTLDLRRPIYEKTAAYGHFGRNDPDFTWEKTDKADVLKKDAGL